MHALSRWGARRRGRRAARRRDRRAGRRRPAHRLSADPGSHPSDGPRARSSRARRPTRSRSSRSICCATATRICARCRWSSAAAGWRRRWRPRWTTHPAVDAGARRRRGAARGGARARLGRARRQGRAVAVPPGRRSREWRKLKLVKRDSFVIGGFTEPRGARSRFGALLLGAAAGGRPPALRRPRRRRLFRRRAGSRRAAAGGAGDAGCPFVERVRRPTRSRTGRGPVLVAEVRFFGVTDDGILRAPIYLGLRDDRRLGTLEGPDPAMSPRGERAPLDASAARRRQAAVAGGARARARPARRARRARRRRAASCPTAARCRSRTWPSGCGRSSASRRPICFATTWTSRRSSCRWCAIARWSCGVCPTASTGTRSSSTARPTTCPPACARAGDPGRRRARPARGRRSHHAALHGPARGHLAGSRGSRARSRPHDVDFAAIDLDPMEGRRSRACATSRAGCATSSSCSASTGTSRRRARAAFTSTCRCGPARRSRRRSSSAA